jgi:glycosyltransferase involved in cell wall biosynthesis
MSSASQTNVDLSQVFTCLRKSRLEFPALSPYNTCLDDRPVSWIDRLAIRLLPGEMADGIRFFVQRNYFDVIITEDYRTAIIFGMLTRLLGRRSRHIVKELYLAEDTLGSQIKRTLFRSSLKRADCIIVNATSERQAYAEFLKLPLGRIVFLPWPSNIPLQDATEDQGYIFAAGRSMRDWKALFACAASLPTPFVIVASRSDVADLVIPPNVTVHCDISRDHYLRLLSGAHIVVLPLTKTVRSTGQAVALEAMAMRKPIITADTPGIADYIVDMENGLFYQAENPSSLRHQLCHLLTSPELRDQLVSVEAERIRTTFNKDHYREALKGLMSQLMKQTAA